MKLQPTRQSKENPESYKKFKNIVLSGAARIKTEVAKAVTGFDLDVDILFNAYTETEFGTHIRNNDNFNFEKIYADSGGLQIVTLGKPVDDTIKKTIYETQKIADYAMCFDEIPTISIGNGTAGRASTGDKLYQPERAESCAIKTANNIKEQCEVLKDSKSTVFYIIQGNTVDDMISWFDSGATVMTDYSKIGGLALADTCMGNGTLESIEMIVAYNSIRQKYSSSVVKNHIHLLGVGSVTRLLPFIYSKGGMLPEDLTVSFDSTSFSMTYMMGKFKNTDNSNVARYQYEEYFNTILDYLIDQINTDYDDFDRKEFITHIIDSILSTSDTINKSRWPEAAQAFITMTILYQLHSFISSLNKSIKLMKNDNSALGRFKLCTNYDQYQSWKSQFGQFIDSKRIRRDTNTSLDEFF